MSLLERSQPHDHVEHKHESGPYLNDHDYKLVDMFFRASNYLTVGQIYLKSNPLLRKPLTPDDIKPRLLGHWGTSPILAMIYAHMNRLLVKDENLEAIYLCGPGHGGPALIGSTYIEHTYTETYPNITEDEEGLRKFFRQFSSPGGIPSHVSPPTPGSIHEGGELGYVLMHAQGAVFDNPNLIALAVVGDGEAETGPLEGSWKGISFINAARDGAVLPIVHVNGHKISGPTVFGRENDANIYNLLSGHGYDVHFVEGDQVHSLHHDLARTLEVCVNKIKKIQAEARLKSPAEQTRSHWPLIVLRSPKGLTGPNMVDGIEIEGTFRAHQVPLSGVKESPAHLQMLEEWMRSYKPDELFDAQGKLTKELDQLIPKGARRMSAHPASNPPPVDLSLPDFRKYAVDTKSRGNTRVPSTHQLGQFVRDIYAANPKSFRLFCPDETNSNKLGAVFEREKRCFMLRTRKNDDAVGPDGRVMEVLSEHLTEGWLEGYVLTGRHGLWVSYEAFSLIVSSNLTQHAKWLDEIRHLSWRTKIPSLNVLLSSTCWRNDHNGFSHQGPGLMDAMLSKKGEVVRVYLPPDANCLLSVADHCFRSRGYLNLIVQDKQPQLQYLTVEEAIEHCRIGVSEWKWASHLNAAAASSSSSSSSADVILCSVGDIATMELLAAADFLKQHCPDFQFKFINVVDLCSIYHPSLHPHGVSEDKFKELFGEDDHVVCAFHGYPGAMHTVLHRRPHPGRFHVRGYNENGTTTTPMMMTILNCMSRFHLVQLALKHSKRPYEQIKNGAETMKAAQDLLAKQEAYVLEELQDLPEVSNWTWKN